MVGLLLEGVKSFMSGSTTTVQAHALDMYSDEWLKYAGS